MCAHVYTRTAAVATLVGWQVNKVNSPVCPTSILHRRQKVCVQNAQHTRICGNANDTQLGFILETIMIDRSGEKVLILSIKLHIIRQKIISMLLSALSEIMSLKSDQLEILLSIHLVLC